MAVNKNTPPKRKLATPKKSPAVTITPINKRRDDLMCDLSICMIGRNEEATLEKCFQTMQPLRDYVHCELIFTDTGSTDRTVEIAEEYADTVLHFEWCDDFSAARNYGLKHSKGAWMVYFDCDHFFDESLQALIDFMNLPEDERDQYQSAQVKILNYTNANITPERDLAQSSTLLHNMTTELKQFIHPIHENIPILPNGSYFCETYVHHLGYADGKANEKHDRNRPIIENYLKKHPDNVRMTAYVLAFYPNPHDVIRISEEALPRLDGGDKHIFLIYNFLMTAYIDVENYHAAQDLLKRFMDKYPAINIPMLEMVYRYVAAYPSKRFEDTLEKAYSYLDLYNVVKSDPNAAILASASFHSLQMDSQATVCHHLALYYSTEENFDAKKLTDILNRTKAALVFNDSGHPTFAPHYFKQAIKAEAYHLIAQFCNTTLAERNTPAVVTYLLDTLNTTLKSKNNEVITAILSGFKGDVTNTLVAVAQLRLHAHSFAQCDSAVLEQLTAEQNLTTSVVYGDVLLATMVSNQDPLALMSMPMRDMVQYILYLAKNHEEFPQRVHELLATNQFTLDSLKKIHLFAVLAKSATIKLCDQAKNVETFQPSGEATLSEQVYDLFAFYLIHQFAYLTTVYSEAFFDEEFTSMLADDDVFVLSVYPSLADNNIPEHIQALKIALERYPDFAHIITTYSTELLSSL